MRADVPALGIGGPGVALEVSRPRGRGARREPRVSDEDGSALVELTWLGILLLVPMLWIVLSVFEVQRGAFAVSGAARAAGRAYALAPDRRRGPARAEAAAPAGARRPGRRRPPVHVGVTCTPYPGDCHTGTSVITVVVGTRVDLPLLPSVLGGDAPSFALDATHTVPIGQFQETVPMPQRRDERGQATVLIVGLAVVLLMAIARRGRRVGGVPPAPGPRHPRRRRRPRGRRRRARNGRDLYSDGRAADRLDLQQRVAAAAVADHLAATGAHADYPGLSLPSPSTGRRSVIVHVRAPLDLPLDFPGAPGSAPVSATASATVQLD